MAAEPLPPHTRSARLTLISLLLIPLLSLAVLWGLIASITLGNVIRYQHYNTVITAISPSVTGLEQTLPVERAITLVWLGSGRRSTIMLAELTAARHSTDKYVPAVRSAVMSVRGLLSPNAIAQMNVFLEDLAGLGRIRAAVDSGAYDPVAAFNAYSAIGNAEYEFFHNSSPPADPDLSLMTQAAIAEARAQDFTGGAMASSRGRRGGRPDVAARTGAVRADGGAAEPGDRRHVLAGQPGPDRGVQAGLRLARIPEPPGHREPDRGQPG